ncbi:MAG: alpha/beta fold hydrolase [Clostridia bacterium]|nr:alpha/beta fold hydrolase [Clostridia bacterium]
MNETGFTLLSPVDSLPLSCLITEPDDKPKGIVLLMHSIMEYKDRFLPLMRRFNEIGFVCGILDQRGYGKSVKSPDDYGYTYGAGAKGVIRDMEAFRDELLRRYPTLKLYLYGHSMGALIALCCAKRWGTGVSGVILSALPAYNGAIGAGKQYLKLKRTFKGERFRDKSVSKLMFDNYSAKFKGEASPFSWLNSDPQKVKEYEEDPLCGGLCTVDGYMSLLDLMSEAYDKKGWEKVSGMLPVFIAAGGDDPCADGEKGASEGERFLKERGLARAEHKTYEGLRHELHNEPAAPEVIHDYTNRLTAWL